MSSVFDVIKLIFWNSEKVTVDRDTYDVLAYHMIDALAASALSRIEMPDDLRMEWKTSIMRQVVYNAQVNYVQNHLPITVPYVVLKGSSAAQYYPYPEYRIIGDIDIITRREDFDQAYQELLQGGFVISKELDREVGFLKNDVLAELHRFFASLNDPKQAKYMDDLIIENIGSSHMLPDDINGLVLLEHINQHLERGLGLRQIIDWMMFVDKCLPDEKWLSFQNYAKAIGLDSLAIVATRMCELYLGLPHREWCSRADEKLCKQLMDYILACGNFGNVRSENIGTGENVFYFGSTPKSMLGLLTDRGMANWKAAQKHAILRPFAWIYQTVRYIKRGLSRADATAEIKKEHKAAKQRIKMFKALGVRQSTKGLAVYKNGKYIKE
ncbi:nucleotidyltransferase family protein [Clostridiales bacterium]|nr:nucleotidyltransferase family protein [Clostridiales bacterium]